MGLFSSLFGGSKSSSSTSSNVTDNRTGADGNSGIVVGQGASVIQSDANALHVALKANENQRDIAKSSSKNIKDFASESLRTVTNSFDSALDQIGFITSDSYNLVENVTNDSFGFSKTALTETLRTIENTQRESFSLAKSSNEDAQQNSIRAYDFVKQQSSSELKNVLEPTLKAAIWLFGGAAILKVIFGGK